MSAQGVDACVLTSMHNVAYYSGFLYCSFGRPYACVVTPDQCVTVSAGIDAGQPWRRSVGDNITYTDWQRDNYWRVVASITGPLGRADADFVKARTGFSIGGVSPLAHAEALTVLIDRSLFRFDAVWAAAGHPNGVFCATPDELVRLAAAPVADVVQEPAP
jgi:Xaa-Pro aminopeptidase